MKSMIHKIAKC